MTTGVASAGLVGRQNELQLLSARLEEARAGRGGSITVSAGPGSGKTALMDAVTPPRGCCVLRCRGLEAEVELPFSGLQQLLMPLLDQVSELSEGQQQAVAAATSLRGDHGVSAIDVALGTLSLVAQAATEQAVLLLVDDLHWLDPATQQVLRFVVPRLSHDAVLVVMTTRPTDSRVGGGEQLQLDPLSPADTTALAEQQAGRPLLTPTATAIYQATGGNPLAIVETIRLHGDDLDRLGTALDEPLEASALIELGFEKRLAELPEATRTALAIVATALTDAGDVVERAAAALNLPGHALDAAEEHLLIKREPGTITFVHPLLRARVYHDIAPAERRRINGALAQATPAPGLSAWHAGAASLDADESLAAALEAAATEFQARGGFLASARALERAARLSPRTEDRARRLLEAGGLALYAGRLEWASTCLDEAAELTSDPARELHIALSQYRVSMARGGSGAGPGSGDYSPDRLMQLAERALVIDASLACGYFASALTGFSVDGDAARANELLHRLDTFAAGADTAASDRVAVAVGITVLMNGSDPIRGRELLVLVARRRLAERHVDIDTDVLVEGLVWVEEHALADELSGVELDRARVDGDVYRELSQLSVDGYRYFRTGDWERARHMLEQACRLSEAAGERYHLAIGLATHAVVHGSRGDDHTLSLCDEVRAIAKRHAYTDLEPHLNAALGIYHLARGRAGEALIPLETMETWCRAGGYQEPGIFSWQADLVDAYAVTGQHPQAQQALDRMKRRSEASDWIWPRATISRLEGTLASGSYEEHFNAALDGFGRLPSPFDRGRTHLAYGRRLRRDGHRDAALKQLTLAAEQFGQIAAVGWLEQTATELAALGANAPQSLKPAAAKLTRQEQAVADCISRGMTNKEAAAHLFLTPKTIEWHLRQIYRKLGIKSRTQLAAHIHRAAA